MEIFKDYTKILLTKNTKDGHLDRAWGDSSNHKYIHNKNKTIDINKFNYGILTGECNNLLVVDIDVKDRGVDEFQQYVNEYGMIKTLTITTPRDGLHLYFKYKSSNDIDNELIMKHMTTKTGFRGVGIDVRSNKGYIMGPGSIFNNNEYEVLDDQPIAEIPSDFLAWLVCGVNTKTSNYQVNNDLKYIMTDDDFKNILFQFKPKDYNEWLYATTMCKCHDKYDIWDEWCRSLPDYDYKKNHTQYNSNSGKIDINFLCHLLKLPKIQTFKPFKTEESNINNKVVYNNKFVYDKMFQGEQYDYKTFKKYDTHVIKSCCGTGKTTAVNTHMKRYLKKQPELKFLSIVTRQTLADQHVTSFKDINMQSYKEIDDKTLFYEQSLVICINSLWKLDDLTDDQIENTIIYIDEINSFLEFSHNDTLTQLKKIYQLLLRLINKAHKVIVSDAMIKAIVFGLFSKRNQDKMVYFINKFKKFENVPAIKVRDEELFMNKMIQQCNKGDGEPFFFGSDSCETAEELYYLCKGEAPVDKQDKFLLFTAEEHITIHDANEQFKGKFIFYSPKITFGIDFNIDTPQNVYIYQKGKSIMPSGSYQQTTRCRNIKSLYYYSEVKEQKAIYEDLNDVKKTLTRNTNKFKSVYDLCSYFDDEKSQIINNKFFDIYSYNEYSIDVYKTNMTKHYEDILIENGFKLAEEGKPIKMDKEDKKDLKEVINMIKEELFEEFLEAEDETLEKYKPFVKRIDVLRLPKDKTVYQKYEDEIKDKYKIQTHFDIIRILKDQDYIKRKLDNVRENSFDVKTVENKYNKIMTLHHLENKYNIKHLEVDYKLSGDINMDESEYNYLKKLFNFRNTKQQPKTYDELRSIYVSMIKHITTNDIIESKQSKSRKDNMRDKRVYTLNNEMIKYHLDLSNYNNPNNLNYHEDIIGVRQ